MWNSLSGDVYCICLLTSDAGTGRKNSSVGKTRAYDPNDCWRELYRMPRYSYLPMSLEGNRKVQLSLCGMTRPDRGRADPQSVMRANDHRSARGNRTAVEFAEHLAQHLLGWYPLAGLGLDGNEQEEFNAQRFLAKAQGEVLSLLAITPSWGLLLRARKII